MPAPDTPTTPLRAYAEMIDKFGPSLDFPATDDQGGHLLGFNAASDAVYEKNAMAGKPIEPIKYLRTFCCNSNETFHDNTLVCRDCYCTIADANRVMTDEDGTLADAYQLVYAAPDPHTTNP